MRLKLAYFMCLFLGLFCSCNNKLYTLTDLPENQLVFGDGGGFTGAYQEFLLLENGQVFKSSKRGGTYEEQESIDKKAAKALFKQAASLNLAEKTINDPGNMTYFIHYKDADKTSKVIWGGNQKVVNEEVRLFFNSLKKAVKDQNAKALMPEVDAKQ